ncbi:Flp family type IVb pilin [Desulfurispora thermophila]|uniref:Flp family type IVb pilin n=1 Tax=Desulfurispora thermophila TaxID=265470 RepID=UPI0003795531|nr:hypothetical protein [Desulfurispora thermophila]
MKTIINWLRDERSSVVSEKGLLIAVGVIAALAASSVIFPGIKNVFTTANDRMDTVNSDATYWQP